MTSKKSNKNKKTNNNTMILVEKHMFKPGHKFYDELDHVSFLSKNLYNSTLFAVRQEYFKNKKYLNYNSVNAVFTHSNQVDYRALPAKVAKQTQMLVDKNFKSFFKLLKKKNAGSYNNRVSVPGYLDKLCGRQVVFYEKGALSFAKKGFIKLSGTNVFIKSGLSRGLVRFVRVVPYGGCFCVEVGYEVDCGAGLRFVPGAVASVDLGLNNLLAVSSNVFEPFVVNGRPLKSINQFYNKKRALMQKELRGVNGESWSKGLSKLTVKRNNRIRGYVHKCTSLLVNRLVSSGVGTLVVGYNAGWKQDINIGSRNNQNFVQVPFGLVVEQLRYKCELVGIDCVLQEESYTSRASFLDNDVVPVFNVSRPLKYCFSGSRVRRGLYRTFSGSFINADVNGSLNILRKFLVSQGAWNDRLWSDLVEVCSVPSISKITPCF